MAGSRRSTFSPPLSSLLRSPASIDLKDCFVFHSGCCGASSRTRSSANPNWMSMGCSDQSVPSFSNTAMRPELPRSRARRVSSRARRNSRPPASCAKDIGTKLGQGHQAGNKNFKVHLDGYDFLPYLTGQAKRDRTRISSTSRTTGCSRVLHRSSQTGHRRFPEPGAPRSFLDRPQGAALV